VRGGKEKWVPGTVVKIVGSLTYCVRVPGNNRRFVQVDHLLPDDSNSGTLTSRDAAHPVTYLPERYTPDLVTPHVVLEKSSMNPSVTLQQDQPRSDSMPPLMIVQPVLTPDEIVQIAPLRRSGRLVTLPIKLIFNSENTCAWARIMPCFLWDLW
jgi:hypothetical protein